MKTVVEYFKGVRYELSKMVWPKREVVVKLTLVVFISSVIVAVYLGGLDLIFTKLLETLIAR